MEMKIFIISFLTLNIYMKEIMTESNYQLWNALFRSKSQNE